jgi:hypothetical protein
MEGTTLGLRYDLAILRRLGIDPKQQFTSEHDLHDQRVQAGQKEGKDPEIRKAVYCSCIMLLSGISKARSRLTAGLNKSITGRPVHPAQSSLV